MHHVPSNTASSDDDLRNLPPRGRVKALREKITRRFGSEAIGFAPRLAPRMPRPHTGRVKLATPSAFLALAIVACLSLCLPAPAHASTLDLSLNVASIHTERWARDELNQVNPGAGLAYHWNRTWAVAGGVYTNSYRQPTVYALAEWTPLHVGQVNHWHVDAGVAAGIATGYTRAEIPCAPLAGAALIRITAHDGITLNVLGVPNMGARNSGFVGFQLSIPLSRGLGRDQ